MKRVAFYTRVSTLDQHPDSQLYDLQQLAQQRSWTVVHEYRDHGICGARVRRPALDQLLADARRGHFDVVAVWACDRLARSTRHFLEVLDELNHLNLEFVSCHLAIGGQQDLKRRKTQRPHRGVAEPCSSSRKHAAKIGGLSWPQNSSFVTRCD